MTINAHPLQWPVGWKRTDAARRKSGRFRSEGYGRPARNLSISESVGRVLAELDRMGFKRDDIVISTNVELRLDGLPRSDRGEPADPGAATYWSTGAGESRVMAIDLYDRVADNLAAVAATLEAMRAIERHGGAVVLERAFTGFAALPAPGAVRAWWEVLGFPSPTVSRDAITAAYRRLRSERHPDRGGTEASFDEVEQAYRKAIA
jgi:hypothetical protein